MDVLTSETCWALNNEIIKQVTSSWSPFIHKQNGFQQLAVTSQVSPWCQYYYYPLHQSRHCPHPLRWESASAPTSCRAALQFLSSHAPSLSGSVAVWGVYRTLHCLRLSPQWSAVSVPRAMTPQGNRPLCCNQHNDKCQEKQTSKHWSDTNSLIICELWLNYI